MKVKKELLDNVEVESYLGQVIYCSLYLNDKFKKNTVSGTIHEQVALLVVKGKDTRAIARKTGFEEKTVRDALRDIAHFAGARNE